MYYIRKRKGATFKLGLVGEAKGKQKTRTAGNGFKMTFSRSVKRKEGNRKEKCWKGSNAQPWKDKKLYGKKHAVGIKYRNPWYC